MEHSESEAAALLLPSHGCKRLRAPGFRELGFRGLGFRELGFRELGFRAMGCKD